MPSAEFPVNSGTGNFYHRNRIDRYAADRYVSKSIILSLLTTDNQDLAKHCRSHPTFRQLLVVFSSGLQNAFIDEMKAGWCP